jgi:hypothetical protein
LPTTPVVINTPKAGAAVTTATAAGAAAKKDGKDSKDAKDAKAAPVCVAFALPPPPLLPKFLHFVLFVVWVVLPQSGGLYVVSGSRDRTLRLWNVATGACIKTMVLRRLPCLVLALSPAHLTVGRLGQRLGMTIGCVRWCSIRPAASYCRAVMTGACACGISPNSSSAHIKSMPRTNCLSTASV